MLNNRGPGESGLAFSEIFVDGKLPASVTNSYDVIGMDTRGIGHSAPMSCGFTVEQSYTGAIPYVALAKALDEGLAPGADGPGFRLATFIGMWGEPKYPETANLFQEVLALTKATKQPQPKPGTPPSVKPSGPAEQLSPADNNFSVFMPCAFWNWAPAEPPVPIVDEGSQNILILQNRRDPATPYVGRTMLREKFEQRSRLVSVDRNGHGVYLFVGSPCADTITSTFLADGTMPAKDLSC